MEWDTEIPMALDSGEYDELVGLLKHPVDNISKITAHRESDCMEVRTLLFEAYWDKLIRIEDEEEWEEFALKHLCDCMIQGKKNDRRMGRVQAADYFAWWFTSLWNQRDNREALNLLRKIKSKLGMLCRDSIQGINDDGVIKEVILLIVLEHIYGLEGVVEYFGGWKRDKYLAAIHEEAVQLSSGFKEMEGK